VRSSRNLYKTIGNAVRAERERARLSQERLAERADLTRNYIGQIERAEKKVTLEALAKVAKALKVRIADLTRDL
jgi:transcriptional regulator with XRE-family HTH domain